MAAGERIVGIDLGTTNSVAACVDGAGRPVSVTNFEGSVLTPSAVFIEGTRVVVGREAVKAAAEQPQRFAECFKRHVGEDYYPQQVDGRSWRPEVLSAMVLRRLARDVSQRLGAAGAAVITVPAYFDEPRRRATRHAGQIAGWNVVDLLNEPTAAAIACAHRPDAPAPSAAGRERLLVFDLGGGTFDTTVLEIDAGREYRTLATEGEVRLGGRDWDERLCAHLAEEFRRQTGSDPLAAPRGRLEFLRLAQTAKHALSLRTRTTVPCRCDGRTAVLEVTRETFERLTADLLLRARTTTEMVLEQARLTWKDIHRVLLTGGSTRMPQVARLFEEWTGRPPDQSLSPDEAVAHGAAIYAHLHGVPGGARAVNVTAHSYGVVCVDRARRPVAVPLIPKNSPLPRQARRLFPVQKGGAGQVNVAVAVCEGESADPSLCSRIGVVQIRGLPPVADSKRWKVTVTLTCLADGRITVDARAHDPDSDSRVVQHVNATLAPDQGMSADDVAAARQTLATLEIH